MAIGRKYKVTVRGYDSETDRSVTVEQTFEDWVYDGKIVCPLQESIDDWAYNYFDKSNYIVLSIIPVA